MFMLLTREVFPEELGGSERRPRLIRIVVNEWKGVVRADFIIVFDKFFEIHLTSSLKCTQTDVYDIKTVAKIHKIADGNGFSVQVNARAVKVSAIVGFRNGEFEGADGFFIQSPCHEFGADGCQVVLARSGAPNRSDSFV